MTAGKREHARPRGRGLLFSVRGRATLITVAVSALILVLALVLMLLLARDWAENRVARETERTAERIAFGLSRGTNPGIIETRPDEAQIVQVVNPQGRVVASTEEIRGRPALATADLARGELLIDQRVCPRYLRECVWAFGLRLRTSPWGQDVMVIAAAPLPGLLNLWLLPVLLFGLLVALLSLIAWWTWHTIGQAFVPVDLIRAEMADLDERGLDHRVPVPDGGGGIQNLAETVNATLDRLEAAANRERRFVSDASHDLRNPITGLQTRLEVALDEPDDADWKPMVRGALRDTQRLNDIVGDLLEQSRLDARAPQPVEPVDLAALVRREVGLRTAGVPIRMRLEPGVVVRANPLRLSRVLGNLLGNAERHADSRIEVTVAREDGDAVMQVLDDGSGIPAESRERVFERFARLPESRERDPHGTGLGLPIAREIAEIYGGSLRIADSRAGARFVLRLPLVTGDGSAR
ncbi:HAMP domain-containing sensor histidine kinase [Actinomadura sp. WMMA1423]|uniref:sensor histidine kinase n=1 Tax=Actinomadura sp. WMMA1423 TaxID=2591108 RepID=UPI001F0D83EC|nr:HAMP domain-containing sensor histidine kinase [Actinomadura sp. WMMA1423]